MNQDGTDSRMKEQEVKKQTTTQYYLKYITHVYGRQKKRQVWKKGTAEKWEKFNELMEQYNHSDEITTYDQLNDCINKAMVKSIGKKWITTNSQPRESAVVKEKRTKKKEARKSFMRAIKTNWQKQEMLNAYTKAQIELQEAIQAEEQQKLLKIFNSLIEEGGIKSQNLK